MKILFTAQSRPSVWLAQIDRGDDGGYVGTFVVFDDMVDGPAPALKIPVYIPRTKALDYGAAESELWKELDELLKKIGEMNRHRV